MAYEDITIGDGEETEFDFTPAAAVLVKEAATGKRVNCNQIIDGDTTTLVFGTAPTANSIVVRVFDDGGAADLDAISEGETNKHFTATEKDALAALVSDSQRALANPLYLSSSMVEPIPLLLSDDAVEVTAERMQGVLFTMRESADVESILTVARESTHASATACRLGIYQTAAPVGDVHPLTCISRSAHSADRWSPFSVNEAPIVDDGAEDPETISHVTLVAGVRYAVFLLSAGHSGAVNLAAKKGFRPVSLSGPPRGIELSSQTDLPPEIESGCWFTEWNVPWFGLSIAS